MTNTLKISSHDELISSIPHTLGFTPRGMVCLAFGDGPTARLDIPESPEEMGEFLQATQLVDTRGVTGGQCDGEQLLGDVRQPSHNTLTHAYDYA